MEHNTNSTIEISWDQFATGDLPESPAKRLFRQAVAAATLQMLDALPEANGRVERARDLVLCGNVTLQDDMTFLVRSLGANGKDYCVTASECTCPDAAKGHRCKHLIATWIWHKARAAVEDTLAAPATPAPAEPLFEAPASCNLFLLIAGRSVQVTLRDHDEHRLLVRLDALLQRFPSEAAPPPAPEAPPEPVAEPQGAPPPATEPAPPAPPAAPEVRPDWCERHGVQMKERRNARGVWHSHQGSVL